jgi:hypothetical protein
MGKKVLITLAATAVTGMAISGLGYADDQSTSQERVSTEIGRAVAAQSTHAAAAPGERRRSGADTTIPAIVEVDGDQAVRAGNVAFRLPGAADIPLGRTTAVSSVSTAGYRVAAQGLGNDGARGIIHIDSPSAPERYDFVFDGVTRLKQDEVGSVALYGAHGRFVGAVAPAWARDAAGRNVPTHYEVKGTTLVQVVEHRGGGFAYGVTADPTVRSIIEACLKGSIGGASLEGIIGSIDSVKNAVKFVVRRVGVLAAVGCAGAIVWEYV